MKTGRRQRRQPRAAAQAPAEGFPWLWCGLAVVLAVVVYLPSLANPFVYDDLGTVVNNPSIRHPVAWRWVFGYTLFRPLVNASYAVDSYFWGLDPFGYHLTGLLLHAANTGLFFTLCRGVARDLAPPEQPLPRAGWTAFFPAALFAAHPLMVEAVQYVSARSELLCALFSLLSLLAFRAAALTGRVRFTAAALVAMLLGLASKEVAAVVPLIALAYDRLVLAKAKAGFRRRLLRLYLPPLAMVALVAGARLALYFGREAAGASSFIGRNLLMQVKVLWSYLGLVFLPSGQSIIQEFREVGSILEPAVLAALTGLVLLLGLAWRIRHAFPLVTLGVLWFLAALLPSSSIAPLAEPMAEHRAYLAGAGAFLALGSLAARLAERWRSAGRRGLVAALAAGLLVLGLAGAAVARIRVWRDPFLLWADAAGKAPNTYAAHYALAEAYRGRGDCPSAIPEYRRALERVPDEPDAWVNLGICSAETRAFDQARYAFERALALDPGRGGVHYNLGLLARMRGDRAAAHQHFLDAVRITPEHELAKKALQAGY